MNNIDIDKIIKQINEDERFNELIKDLAEFNNISFEEMKKIMIEPRCIGKIESLKSLGIE